MKNVILDTDFSSDIGDMAALLLTIGLHKVGVFNLLGVIVSSSNSKAPGAVNAVLKQAGLGSIPIGCWKGVFRDPNGLEDTPPVTTSTWGQTVYNSVPRDIGLASTVSDGLDVYTTLLTNNSDVTIIGLGGPLSFNQLLVSQPALVAAKVTELSWFAGGFPSRANGEFNQNRFDYPTSLSIMSNWPTQITYTGYENGVGILTGGNLTKEFAATDAGKIAFDDSGSPAGRDSWDNQPVLWAAFGKSLFTTVRGTNAGDGSTGNVFTPNAAGKDQYTVKAMPDQIYAAIANNLIAHPRSGSLSSWKYGHSMVIL